MAVPAGGRMTVDAFAAWPMEQPPGRHELVGGEIVATTPERAAHAETRAEAWLALRNAIVAAGAPCQALPAGRAVRIDAATVCKPDALARWDPGLPPDAVSVSDPVIVVEILSPSNVAVRIGQGIESESGPNVAPLSGAIA